MYWQPGIKIFELTALVPNFDTDTESMNFASIDKTPHADIVLCQYHF